MKSIFLETHIKQFTYIIRDLWPADETHRAYSLLLEADVVCHKIKAETALLLKTVKLMSVKRMLFLGNVLLRCDVIHNLEVSFTFHYD